MLRRNVYFKAKFKTFIVCAFQKKHLNSSKDNLDLGGDIGGDLNIIISIISRKIGDLN